MGRGSSDGTNVNLNGVEVAKKHPLLNLIEGANIDITVSENTEGDVVDVTITGSAAGVSTHDALTGVTANQHHAQSHVLDGANHTTSGLTTGHLLTALSASTFGFLGALEINVKRDYGAVGDGTTDDSTAIQNALNAVGAFGGVVVFPPGTYKVTTALTSTTSSLHLLGYGATGQDSTVGLGATVINYTGSGVCFTFGDGASTIFQGPVIEGLHFQGSSSGTGGIRVRRANNWVLRRVVVSGYTAGYGVFSDGTGNVNQYNSLIDCGIHNCQIGYDGLLTNGTRIVGGYFDGNSNSGNYVAGTTAFRQRSGDTLIMTCPAIQYWETCVDLQGSEGHQIIGARFEGFSTGLKMAGDRCAVYGGTFNNNIIGGTGTAISLTAAADSNILIPADIAAVDTDISDSGTNTMRFWNNRFGGPGGYMEPGSTFLTAFDSFKVYRHLWVNSGDNAGGSLLFGSSGTLIDTYGTGSPEGVVTAGVGSTYRREDGGTDTTLYRKESGSGNTGWVAVSNSSSSSGDTLLAWIGL